MSGLVFVQDAQARPLMPTSAAYARTLLRQRKARLEPHPSFTLIRLTRIVAAPVVRPVLLVIVLHRTTAELLLVINNARTAPISVSILVDLSSMHNYSKGLCVANRSLTSRRRHTSIASVAIRVPTSLHSVMARRHARVLTSVIVCLQSLLPISHVTVPSAPAASVILHDYSSLTKQVLVQTLTTYTKGLTLVDPARILTSTLPPALIRIFSDVAARRTSFVPAIVVPFRADRWRIWKENLQHEHHLSIKAPPNTKADGSKTSNNIEYGHLCTIYLTHHTVTGLICGPYSRAWLTLRIVHRLDPRRIHWRLIRVPATVPRRLWPPHTALLLPAPSADVDSSRLIKTRSWK